MCFIWGFNILRLLFHSPETPVFPNVSEAKLSILETQTLISGPYFAFPCFLRKNQDVTWKIWRKKEPENWQLWQHLPQLSVFWVARSVIFILLFLHHHFVPHLVTWSRVLLLQSLCKVIARCSLFKMKSLSKIEVWPFYNRSSGFGLFIFGFSFFFFFL